MLNYKTLKHCLLLTSILMLTACAGNATPKKIGSDKEIYDQALSDIGHDNNAAIEKLNFLELNYPQSANLPDTMVLKLYAYYTNKQFDEAIMQANRFIKLYPNSSSTPYVYYIKGMANYGRMMDVSKDQQNTVDAMTTFKELMQRFPDSEYSRAASTMFDHTENMMAAKEMDVGRFYAQRGQYAAAAGRFDTVLRNYNHTIVAPEAIYRMVEIHHNMNTPHNAVRYTNMLQQRHPDNVWTKRAVSIVSYYGNNQPRMQSEKTTVKSGEYRVPELVMPNSNMY